MTTTIWRRTSAGLCVLLMLLAVLATGCNIFSWTHDEGGSSDAETLVQDARDALLDQKYSEALQYARKGIENDPAPMKYPELRWIGASAVLAESGVNLSQLMNALSNSSGTFKASGGGTPHIADTYQILNLTTEELLALASSCPQALAFLAEVLDALANGDITPQDIIGFQFDIELGFGVSSLMTAFLTVIDEDNSLDNGFVQNPDIKIYVLDNGAYAITDASGMPIDPTPYVCPLWPELCGALLGINQAYATATLPNAWGDVSCGPGSVGPLYGTPDENYVIGQVLRFVHDGLSLLTQTVTCTP